MAQLGFYDITVSVPTGTINASQGVSVFNDFQLLGDDALFYEYKVVGGVLTNTATNATAQPTSTVPGGQVSVSHLKENVSVTIRKQGATVTTTSGTAIVTVRDIGGLVVGDVCRIGTSGSDLGTILTIDSQTQVTFSTTVSVTAGDRLTPRNNLPSIYNNAAAAGSPISNPLTTDSNGYTSCFPDTGGKFDALLSGGGITTRLLEDQTPHGLEKLASNAYGSGSAILFTKDSSRALAAGDVLEEWKNNGTRKFSILDTGQIDPVGGIKGPVSVTGGDFTIDSDLVMSAAVSQIVPGATSLSLRNNADGVDNLLVSDAGDVTVRGSLTVTGRVKASVTRVDAQTITTATPTPVAFDNEEYDSDSMHDNVTNNDRVTIPAGEGGLYLVALSVAWEPNATGTREMIILKNGLSTPILKRDLVEAASAIGIVQHYTVMMELDAADYVSVQVQQTSGGDLDVVSQANANTWLRVHRIA